MSWTGFQYREVDADGWTTLWRLDPRGQDFALTDWTGRADRPGHRLWVRAATPAGVRGSWRTTASSVELDIRAALGLYNRIAPVDVLVNGTLHQRCELHEGEQRLTIALPGHQADVELWLPQAGVIAIREPAFDGPASGSTPDGPRWVTYGSSITQCAGGYGPSETWPAVVARRQGWRCVNLGFGGECHLDPVAARTIRDLPADLVSLCLGINIHGGETFNGRTLAAQVQAFIATVREGHPETPLVVITPLIVPNREGRPNGVGLTLDDVRALVEAGARTDPAVQLIDGRDLFTPDEARALYTDDVHPGPDGYLLLADRLTPHLAKHLANL